MKKVFTVLLLTFILAGAGKVYVVYNEIGTSEFSMGVETAEALTFIENGEETKTLSSDDLINNYETHQNLSYDDYVPHAMHQYNVIEVSREKIFVLNLGVKSVESGDLKVDFDIPNDMRVFVNKGVTTTGDTVHSFSESNETTTLEIWFWFEDPNATDKVEEFNQDTIREGYFTIGFNFYLE